MVARSKIDYDSYFDDVQEEDEEEVQSGSSSSSTTSNPQPQKARYEAPSLSDPAPMDHDCRLASDAGPIHSSCPLSQDQIHRAIATRQRYQRRRQYGQADHLLQGLNKAGVYVHDKRQEWRADGTKSFGAKPYAFRGGNHDNLPRADLDRIASIVARRSSAKRDRDFQASDLLQHELSTQYNVQVDDKRREWSFVSLGKPQQPYVPTPLAALTDPTHTLPAATRHEIQHKLQLRVHARANKHYREADAIRNELLQQHSVVVDDRTREWKVVSDWDDDQDWFVAEAKKSQQSAFAQRQEAESSNSKQRRSSYQEEDSTELSLEQELEQELDSILFGDQDSGDDVNEDDDDDEEDSVSEEGTTMKIIPEESEQDIIVEAEPEIAASSNYDADSLSSLTVVALKEKLKEAGLPVSGRKAELIDRLLSA